MARASSKAAETRVLISGSSVVVHEGVSYSPRPSIKIPIRDQDDYPTISTANSSYCQSTSTTHVFSPTSLTTIVISKTATTTLTTIAFVTSERTITTVAPTEAPILSSKPVRIVLSSGKIAGIVVGSITGLLILVLLFYLLLTRVKWLTRLAKYRLERKEKEYYERKAQRPKRPKRAKKPTDNTTRNSYKKKNTVDRKHAQHKRVVKTRPVSLLLAPNQR
ncbi:hypothetical protein FHL15_002018 [Xylaria flabelliformis]|uniref:Uncharacterized protein n=1 Tax=Xylaria flabelliformis TaxID=2512241 RepID=A0A553IAK7_9PEZI|nr:hypothetical protein FHL15_002018 [Xylaria flabelliformis]